MVPNPHVLVVDDEEEIRENIRDYLVLEGIRVTAVATGNEMREVQAADPAQVVILDVRLSGESGLDLAVELHEKSDAAIIILSQKDDVIDRVAGLELGADDYLTKPFHMRELLARIRSLLRRVEISDLSESPAAAANDAAGTVYSFDGWRLDRESRQLLSPSDDLVELSSGEFDLLVAFLEHPNRVLSRDQLLDFAHNRDTMHLDRSIDVQVGRLRRKIENDPKRPALIKTVRGAGYKFSAAVAAV